MRVKFFFLFQTNKSINYSLHVVQFLQLCPQKPRGFIKKAAIKIEDLRGGKLAEEWKAFCYKRKFKLHKFVILA
jgi:hypothetical protein